LQERIDCYGKTGRTIGYNEQQNVLPDLKRDMPELVPLGSHALQATLKRLDLAMAAFFRRVKDGQTPGFPRYKGKKRFDSFSYPDPAGWSLTGIAGRAHLVRIGELFIRARGKCRFDGYTPNDLTVKRIGRHWEVSITLRVSREDCRRERTGQGQIGFDQGLTDRMAFDNGDTLDNPRWLREKRIVLEALSQDKEKCKKGSRRYRKLNIAIARLHRTVANCRKDWLHKLSTTLVSENVLIATEELAVANMTRAPKPKPELDATGSETGHYLPNGAASKAGLNRELNSAGLGALLNMLRYKAEEADSDLHVSVTRRIKPTQRCARCGHLVKKQLDERVHLCPECGFIAGRDRNAALVCLIDALCPGYWRALDKGKPATLGPYAASIKNKLLYAAQDLRPGATGTAVGTIVDTDLAELICMAPETPTYSAEH
jgi:putative transposase